jgi:hypothetical protein
MTTLLWGQDGLTNTTCTPRSAAFTVPATGTYYLGFHCTSAANMWRLVIDDLTLSYTTAPACNIYPCASGPAFDLSFRDQYNRSEICLSSATGDYIYNVLTGPHAGDSFTGTAAITRYGTTLFLFASPCTGGATHCVSGNWNTTRHTAAATLKAFTPVRYSQTLSDANYLDSPPCAGP